MGLCKRGGFRINSCIKHQLVSENKGEGRRECQEEYNVTS